MVGRPVFSCNAPIYAQPTGLRLPVGVEVQFSESTAALITVNNDTDITFLASRLDSVNAWSLSSILALGMQQGRTVFNGFTATGCNASAALVTLQPDISAEFEAQDSRTVQFHKASFSGSAVGAVRITSYSSAVVTDTSFHLSVGPALNVSSSGQLHVQDSTFSKLTVSDGASALDLQLLRLQVTASNFTDGFGRAISATAFQSISISGSQFVGNSEGAVSCTTPELNITGSHFISNTATLGGALYLRALSGRITGCLFQHNAAQPAAGQTAINLFHTQDGGAIYLNGVQSHGQTFDILDSIFLNNSAFASGGAIQSWELNGVLNIDGCLFGYCQAGSQQGSVL